MITMRVMAIEDSKEDGTLVVSRRRSVVHGACVGGCRAVGGRDVTGARIVCDWTDLVLS